MASAKRKMTAMTVALSLAASGCASGKEGVGQALGGLLLGGICLALVKGKDKATCIAAAAAGFLIGGAIGRQMDERDKARREQALSQMLDDPTVWQHHRGSTPMANDQIVARPMPKSAPNAAVSNGNEVTWVNPDTANSGRIEPLVAYVGGPQGNSECKQIRETYFKAGQPISEIAVACKDANGKWIRQ